MNNFLQEDSKTYANAKYLEKFFEEQLQKWLPNYAKTNKNYHTRSSGNLHNNTHSSSPASGGTASPSLTDGGGRKSVNSLSSDVGSNPAKRLRSTE